MVVRGGFQTEGDVLQTVLHLDCVCMEAELLESFPRRIEDQLSEKGSSPCGAEEGVMAVLGDIDADQEIVLSIPESHSSFDERSGACYHRSYPLGTSSL